MLIHLNFIKRINFSFILIGLFFLVFLNTTKAEIVKPNSIRSFSKLKMANLKRGHQFQYVEDKSFEDPWVVFKNWIRNLLSFDTGNIVKDKITTWIYIFILVGFFLFAAYKVFGMDKLGLFQKKNSSLHNQFDGNKDPGLIKNHDELILSAINEENYREAIRLWHYKTLLFLDKKGFIKWKIGKTNRSYLLEIQNREFYKGFETLTYFFEYSFYGGFMVNANQFQEIQKAFQIFISSKE
jgi:hypothetical protein